jgi:hypothetical protein
VRRRNLVANDGCSPTCRREIGDLLVATMAALPTINPRSNAMFAVVLLGGGAFDAGAADVSSVRFGPTGSEASPVDGGGLADTDGDGRLDLVLRFKTRDTRFACAVSTALVTGRTVGGVPFVATGPVVLHGCR